MCKPASFIITKTNCYWSKNSDSHEVIIKENNLNDKLDPPQLVRCEVAPHNNDFSATLDLWEFTTDQDILPIWYDANDAEAACRRELPNWLASNVILQNQAIDKCEKYIVACMGRIDMVCDSSRIDMVCDSASIGRVCDSAVITIMSKSIKITPVDNVVVIERSGNDVKAFTKDTYKTRGE